MKITALRVKNFKRVEDVAIQPGDRNLLIIGGRNRQGKSSVLDALSAAFGGKGEVPDQPVRTGAQKAEILVTLDGMAVKRTISAAGTQQIKVTDEHGTPIKSPQKALTALVGARFLDPLEFMRLAARAQRDALLCCVDLGIDLDEWGAARARCYSERTEVGRDVKRLTAELEAIGEVAEVEAWSTADLMADIETSLAADNELATAQTALERINELGRGLRDEIKAMEARLAVAKEEIAKVADERATQKTAVDALVDDMGPMGGAEYRAELREQIATAEEHNRRAAAAQVSMELAATATAALAVATSEQDRLTAALATADEQKASALAAAEMPIAGLDVDDGQVLYDGVPLSQASGAQQLEVSLGIAMALQPELRDVWVKDGSLLDADSLEIVRKLAEAHDCRVWLERVGNADDGAIVIEEGKVVE